MRAAVRAPLFRHRQKLLNICPNVELAGELGLRIAVLAFLGTMSFAHVASGEEENRCGLPRSGEADDFCASLTEFLPHFAGSFDRSQLDGRYALNCSAPSGVELSGLSEGAEIELRVDGRKATDVFLPKAYFGASRAPLSFILPVSYTDPGTGEGRSFSVNGDHQGFYILQDWEGILRLSKCPE